MGHTHPQRRTHGPCAPAAPHPWAMRADGNWLEAHETFLSDRDRMDTAEGVHGSDSQAA